MFKLVQKLGVFVVKMYHREADRLNALGDKAKSDKLAVSVGIDTLYAEIDALRAKAAGLDAVAEGHVQQARDVYNKAIALGKLF